MRVFLNKTNINDRNKIKLKKRIITLNEKKFYYFNSIFKQKCFFPFFFTNKYNIENKNKYIIQTNLLYKRLYYIFNIHFLYNNLFFNVLTSSNKNTTFFHSFGFSKAKKSDKRTKLYYMLQIIKKIVFQTKSRKSISINFTGSSKYYSKFLIKFIKKYYYIRIIKIYNLLPHNGCRLKKKK